MSALVKLCSSNTYKYGSILLMRSASSAQQNIVDDEFRVLDLTKKRERPERRISKRPQAAPDRADRMPTDQDWGSVWPGPRSFHPSSVPLPMRQGWVEPGKAPPGKHANAELMKIPNFLHLTPPVIKRQCEALKQFCTEWPKDLKNEEIIEKYYPIEVIASDYCHASPSIRNPLARIVSLRFKLSVLNLDKHARDKFLRLIGDRYEPETDQVTITADRCPIRKQNLEYVNYLLTALYHESWNQEEWESDKTEDDMEYYDFDRNKSRKSLIDWHCRLKGDHRQLTDEEYASFDLSSIDGAGDYKAAVTSLFNDGESEETLNVYGRCTRALFGLPEAMS